MTFAVVFCLLHHSTFVVSHMFLRAPHAVLLGSILSRVIMLPSYVCIHRLPLAGKYQLYVPLILYVFCGSRK